MRRYVARTTPDVVRIRFDPIEAADPEGDVRQLLDRWSARMAVKHPGSTSEVRTWQDSPSFLHVVEARVRLR
jgi:hypothetical protein